MYTLAQRLAFIAPRMNLINPYPCPHSCSLITSSVSFQLPPVRAVLGGFSRASKPGVNEAGAFTNWAADEESCYGNDIEQFGQLLATLLGHCHGSSEYVQVILLLVAYFYPTCYFVVWDNKSCIHIRGTAKGQGRKRKKRP